MQYQVVLGYVDKEMTYLDCPVVQKIIGYKWLDHARGQYIKEFYNIILFAVSYIAGLLIERDNGWEIALIALHITGTIACLLFLKKEMN